MQSASLDHIDRKILRLLQTEPDINASAIGERIGLSQSACWRRIQRLREDGVILDQTVVLDREKVGLTTMVFAHVKLTSHGRSNLSAFAEAVQSFPEVMDCYVACCASSPRTSRPTNSSSSKSCRSCRASRK
jgi:Lrp/AsnC family transcriptional regulator